MDGVASSGELFYVSDPQRPAAFARAVLVSSVGHGPGRRMQYGPAAMLAVVDLVPVCALPVVEDGKQYAEGSPGQ
jgi:hypothetical protein